MDNQSLSGSWEAPPTWNRDQRKQKQNSEETCKKTVENFTIDKRGFTCVKDEQDAIQI